MTSAVWRRGTVVFLPFLAAVALLACSDNGEDAPPGGNPTQASATTQVSPTPKASPTHQAPLEPAVPEGWVPFQEGDFSGYVPPSAVPIYLSASDLGASGTVLNRLDESGQRAIEAALETIGDSDIFFLFFGSGDAYFATNVNILACELNGQPIGGESQLRLGYLLLGVEADVVDEVSYRGTPANLYKPEMSDQVDSFQVSLEDLACNLVVTLSTLPGGYERFAADFKDFIRLLEFR